MITIAYVPKCRYRDRAPDGHSITAQMEHMSNTVDGTEQSMAANSNYSPAYRDMLQQHYPKEGAIKVQLRRIKQRPKK